MIGFLVLLGSGLGLVTAYLIAAGSWYIALGLLAAVPTLILLHKYPLSGLLIWLALTAFLTTESSAVRSVYWVIHRTLPPVAVGILVLGAALRVNQRRLPRLGWAELAMAGYLAVSFVSIITLNDDPQATAYLFYDRVFIPMCLYLLVRLSAPGEADLQRLLPVLCFLAVSQSLIGILSWFAPGVLPSAWLGKEGLRTVGSLSGPDAYSVALIFAGLLLLHGAMNRKPGPVRTLYLSAFVLTVLSDFLSLSRANWLAGMLAILGLIFLYPKSMLRLGLVVVPAVLIVGGGLLSTQFSLANERLTSTKSENTALSRLPVFYAAAKMLEAKPIWGWGYGNFDRYDWRFQDRVGNFENDNKDHASHNFYLTLLAEQGLAGFSLYLAPLVGWLILTLKRLPSMPSQGIWSRKLLIVLWLIALNYIVVTNFSNMRVVFALGLWWVTLGLIAHMVYAHRAPANFSSARTRRAWPGEELRPPRDPHRPLGNIVEN